MDLELALLNESNLEQVMCEQYIIGDDTLWEFVNKVKKYRGELYLPLKKHMEQFCYFLADSHVEGLSRLGNIMILYVEKEELKAKLLENFSNDLAGLVLMNSHDQYVFFLKDATEPGRFRYSSFDKKGFFSHTTRDTYRELLDEAIREGYTKQVDSSILDELSVEWFKSAA